MKKIIFALVAIVGMSLSSNAQMVENKEVLKSDGAEVAVVYTTQHGSVKVVDFTRGLSRKDKRSIKLSLRADGTKVVSMRNVRLAKGFQLDGSNESPQERIRLNRLNLQSGVAFLGGGGGSAAVIVLGAVTANPVILVAGIVSAVSSTVVLAQSSAKVEVIKGRSIQ